MAKWQIRAVVLGAGCGGLAAGAALSRHFREVWLLEHDRLEPGAQGRLGAAQGFHIHHLLRGGELAMEALLPGLSAQFVEAGVVRFRQTLDIRSFDRGGWYPARDLGWSNVSATRPFLENLVRRRLAQEAGVTVLDGVHVEDLRCDASGRVDGVVVIRNGTREEIGADLVVDCTGARGQASERLRRAGCPTPEEVRVGLGLVYVSATYEAPQDAFGGAKAFTCSATPPAARSGLAAQVENGRWQVSLSTRHEAEMPRTAEQMLEFARSLPVPDLARFLSDARLDGPVRIFRKMDAVLRAYDRIPEPSERWLALGDGIASFNPLFGQGMSVAWMQAQALDGLLRLHREAGQGPDSLAKPYFQAAGRIAREAWNTCLRTDLGYVRNPPPGCLSEAEALHQLHRLERLIPTPFLAALRQMVNEDPDLHADYLGVSQMTVPSAALFRPERLLRMRALAGGATRLEHRSDQRVRRTTTAPTT